MKELFDEAIEKAESCRDKARCDLFNDATDYDEIRIIKEFMNALNIMIVKIEYLKNQKI